MLSVSQTHSLVKAEVLPHSQSCHEGKLSPLTTLALQSPLHLSTASFHPVPGHATSAQGSQNACFCGKTTLLFGCLEKALCPAVLGNQLQYAGIFLHQTATRERHSQQAGDMIRGFHADVR